MKKLMILICLLVTSFSMLACNKEQTNQVMKQTDKFLENRSKDIKDIEEAAESSPSQPLVLSEVGEYLRAKGCDDNEIRAMQQIEKETYGPTLYPINFTGSHFNYAGCEGQTRANCGLYAAKRLLHDMGMKGIVSADLWYRYSDEELRDFVVITGHSEIYRNQGETLTFLAVGFLFIHIGLNVEQLKSVNFNGINKPDEEMWDNIRSGGTILPSYIRPISISPA